MLEIRQSLANNDRVLKIETGSMSLDSCLREYLNTFHKYIYYGRIQD